jgi:hypothetical protein
MPRPNPRLDAIKHLGKPIAFSVDDRANIEAKYGRELTSELWEQITHVTSVLTIFIPGIKGATRLPVVLSKLKKLEAAAKSLRSEFNEIPDRGNFTPEEIYRIFFSRRRHCPPGDEFLCLEEILGGVIKFSEFTRQQIQEPDPKQPNTWRSLSEGDAWNIWVNALTKIMKNNGLPYKVRKDKDKTTSDDIQSPFVKLIKELQNCLPKECREFTQSDYYALAQRISRARRGK